ncbi:MAG: biotin-dependent carboxyltransferase family protein, partial [Alphaproteobacteria bacterium]
MNALAVVRAGPSTTVQDLGRWGHQRLGVPVGGALDTTSLRLANAVIGNPEGTAGLEFRLAGPELEVACDAVRVALGGPVDAVIASEPSRGVPPWRGVVLARGERLQVRRVEGAAVGYLAIEGGFALSPVLGSLATYVRASFGGLDGRALRDGDRLPLVLPEPSRQGDRCLAERPVRDKANLRVVLGPQDQAFQEESLAEFLAAIYVVGRDADRMGLRLEGPRLRHRHGADIVSEGVVQGSLQVPASGQPILLLADRQTVGGYTKVATVISADLPAAGRLLPGAVVRFAAVTVAEAVAARRAAEAEIARLVVGIRPAPPLGGLDETALLSENLISGVVGPAGD